MLKMYFDRLISPLIPPSLRLRRSNEVLSPSSVASSPALSLLFRPGWISASSSFFSQQQQQMTLPLFDVKVGLKLTEIPRWLWPLAKPSSSVIISIKDLILQQQIVLFCFFVQKPNLSTFKVRFLKKRVILLHFQKSCLQNLWCCILFLSPTIIPTGFYGCFNLCHSQRETICFRTLWLWADSLNNGTTTDSWHLPTLCSEHIFYVHYRQVCNLEVESKLLERREAMIGEYRKHSVAARRETKLGGPVQVFLSHQLRHQQHLTEINPCQYLPHE